MRVLARRWESHDIICETKVLATLQKIHGDGFKLELNSITAADTKKQDTIILRKDKGLFLCHIAAFH